MADYKKLVEYLAKAQAQVQDARHETKLLLEKEIIGEEYLRLLGLNLDHMSQILYQVKETLRRTKTHE